MIPSVKRKEKDNGAAKLTLGAYRAKCNHGPVEGNNVALDAIQFVHQWAQPGIIIKLLQAREIVECARRKIADKENRQAL
jgi:hypothetical protein